MMRFEFDKDGYVCCILYGCTTGTCVLYTGLVPTQPEQYASMDDWADRALVQAYKLDESGNLVYDAERAAALPNPDDVVLKKYTADECAALGIAQDTHTHTTEDITDFPTTWTTEDISDITCGVAGKVEIGRTVIAGGSVSNASINNKSSGVRDCTIDLSEFGFSGTPILVVTPICSASASAPYGIMTYIKSLSATSATVRITSNYTGADLSVGLRWMAIGLKS